MSTSSKYALPVDDALESVIQHRYHTNYNRCTINAACVASTTRSQHKYLARDILIAKQQYSCTAPPARLAHCRTPQRTLCICTLQEDTHHNSCRPPAPQPTLHHQPPAALPTHTSTSLLHPQACLSGRRRTSSSR